MRLVLNAIATAFLLFIISNTILADTFFDSDVRIIKSDETGITFTYQAPAAELITPDGYPDKFKAPRISRTAQIAKPGEPLLPVKVVPIGIPYNSKPTVTIINGQYAPLAQVDVPNFIIEKSEEQFVAKANKQVPSKTWPLEMVYVEGEDMIRGLRVIKVCLAAAKLENGFLHQAKSITVKVDFHNEGNPRGNLARPNGRIFDNILSEIVANYDIARNWRNDSPLIPLKTADAQSVFDSSQVWVKMEISSEGIYKVSRFELNGAGVDVADIDPREMRVFYGGGSELPIDNNIDRPELREIPIYITGSDDGEFNDSDRLLFYAESVDGLKYNVAEGRFDYRFHHYAQKNVYWLTYGGNFTSPPKRWATVNGAPQNPSAVTASSFTDVAHDEQDLVFYISPSATGNEPDDHFNWFRGNSTSFSITKQLKDVVSGSQSTVVLKTKTPFDSLIVNDHLAQRTSTFSGGYTEYSTSDLRGNTGFNTFLLKDNANFYYDFIDIYYERWLNAGNDQLFFMGPETNYNIEYRLSSVPPNYMLIDISSSDSVARIINGELSNGSLAFQNFSNGKKRFYLFNPANYKNINNYDIYEPDDLRSTANAADYIIITNELFYNQALELADHRESVSPDIRTRVVKIDDIYNQFSWGVFDATAIRDFLKYAFENWSGAAPSYAVLVGDGHYDYRDNLNENIPNLIPPYESTQSSNGRDSYGSDESYVYFGEIGYLDSDSSGALDMIIGRLPVNNTNQMQVVLDKIINYESNPNMGKWRNNIIIAADDNNTPDWSSELMHTRQAESLATECVPAELEVTKIYMVEFPIRTGRTKPDAREALINAFNDGGLIVDWIGHGNKGLWAHEQIFRRIEDMPRLVNGEKLPLVFAASCSIAYFDHPSEQGMAEDFVRHPGGGAIVSIGATRLVFASGNSELNKEMFVQLLFTDSVSFGQALYVAKYLREIPPELPDANARKFTLLGDPALIAGKPSLNAEFTYAPDSLKGLTVDSIAGNITNDLGDIQSDFNGTVWVLVKDASINRHKLLVNYSGIPTGSYLDYELPGPTIFNGPADVVNGRFATSFFIPKDITYGGTGARIYVYFENGDIDGSGVVDSLPMAGGISSESDTTGPTIEIYYNNQNLADRIQAVPTDPVFEVNLFDLHGINVTGSMGHSIKIEVDDGETYSRDITDDFIFERGNWQQGQAVFTIPNLPEGEHLLSLKAWDNYNNSAVFSTYIQAFASTDFAISEVMNYPNPVVKADSTTFQYMLSNDAEAVTLKIFTLAGRKIKTFNLSAPDYTSSGFHNVIYYLKDSDSDRLASGVYIYKIEAIGTGFDGERRSSSFQSKLAILR